MTDSSDDHPRRKHLADDISRREALDALAVELGLPSIAAFRQYGRDRRRTWFELELSDGRRVSLGHVSGLFQQERFRKTVAVALSVFVPRRSPDEWWLVLHDAIAAVEVVDVDDDSIELGRAGRAA